VTRRRRKCRRGRRLLRRASSRAPVAGTFASLNSLEVQSPFFVGRATGGWRHCGGGVGRTGGKCSPRPGVAAARVGVRRKTFYLGVMRVKCRRRQRSFAAREQRANSSRCGRWCAREVKKPHARVL